MRSTICSQDTNLGSPKERRSAVRYGNVEPGASNDHAAGYDEMNHHHSMASRSLPLGVLAVIGSLSLVVACSSSKTSDSGTTTSTAAAVMGAADSHCAGKPVVVADPAVCKAIHDAGTAGDGGADAGMDDGTGDYGPTSYNSEAEDDDCKYHMKWESTNVAENTDITFKVTITNRKDSSPVGGGKPYIEAFLDTKTPAPNSPSMTTETAAGVYTIGPVRFDKPGNWNVRFHVHDECNDSETSPHGHAAFFVKVP
jgi:hypothetical protein